MVDLELKEISEKVICCSLRPRLHSYINQVGKTKVRRFIAQDYWASLFLVLEILKHGCL